MFNTRNEHGAFSGCHPAVTFFFFAAAMLLAMLFHNPLLQAISLAGAAVYAIRLGGKKAVRFLLLACLPMILLWTAVNPFVNRQGVTPFLYVNGRVLTVESLVYGLTSGLMFAAVLLWFYCYSHVVTTDKFLYLFGRTLPSLTLLLSMALRFLPRYARQAARIADARHGAGRAVDEGSPARRLKSGSAILVSLTASALENAIGTADSMNARGYGAARRTRFALYRFGTRDRTILAALAALAALAIVGIAAGAARTAYFPAMSIPPMTGGGSPWHIVLYAGYAGLAFFPAVYDGAEALRWRRLQSKI